MAIERFDLLLLPGDFGNVGLIRMLGRWLEKRGLMGLGVYGNHEERYVVGVTAYGSFRLLGFGEVTSIEGVEILGVPGVRGKRKWYHWSDQDILRILRCGAKADWILAHEMPYGLADACRGNLRCGQASLRALVEHLKPVLYVGGHLHGPPQVAIYRSTLVIKCGTLSNRMSDNFWISFIDTNAMDIQHYQCSRVDESCIEYSVDVEEKG